MKEVAVNHRKGETIDDLQKFDSDEFVNALFDVKDRNGKRFITFT